MDVSESDSPIFWTAERAAATLGIPQGTVKFLHRVGALKAVKIGRHLRWIPATVRAYGQAIIRDAEGAK